jgi:hypothetical protein
VEQSVPQGRQGQQQRQRQTKRSVVSLTQCNDFNDFFDTMRRFLFFSRFFCFFKDFKTLVTPIFKVTLVKRNSYAEILKIKISFLFVALLGSIAAKGMDWVPRGEKIDPITVTL